MEFNLTPEDIDTLVRESIMKAGFGKAVEAAVVKAFTGYGNPVEEAVKRYVGEVAAQLVRERFADQVKAAVSAAIEVKVTPQLIATVVAASTEKMIRAVEDR